MPYGNFGGVRVFRPSPEVELAIRKEARSHLLSRFAPGDYRGAASANTIVQHQFAFYLQRLRPLVERLPNRETLDFLLSQYDATARILHGADISDPQERESWLWVGPMYRRAIKYLAELLCVESSTARKGLRGTDALRTMEAAVVCTESMVHLAQESDLFHSIFPEDCVATVSDQMAVHCDMTIAGTHAGYDHSFRHRVTRDREARGRFIPHPQFDNHTGTHAQYLDRGFQESFGMSYGEFIAAIIAVIDGVRPSPGGPSSLFVRREAVFSELAKSGSPRPAIERAIDGFSIAALKLLEEGRVIWNPKQEHRAYRRGFFIVPHETGLHLAFSGAMAQESLVQLVNWVPYKHLPAEWVTPATGVALNELSSAASEWFEKLTRERLRGLGFIGGPAGRQLGSGAGSLQIPERVGSMDFLGYHPSEKLLVVVESKMVMTGLEARYWRDDLHEFVRRPGSYAERFRRKLSWVRMNASAIGSAMDFGPVEAVGGAMVTLYPCIAKQFIDDFPCVSITELLLDHDLQSRWPYKVD